MARASIHPAESGSAHWRRNLAICLLGSFSTIVAMTLLLPLLPLYVEQLGVRDQAAIVQRSGIAYGATFFTAALVAPLWGQFGDAYGRKLMLVRASFGMAIVMSLTGMVDSVWQLVALRLLTGLAGGYSSGSMILVAAQTPKDRTGWAIGMVSSGIMAGNIVGPLIGGSLPPLIGIRETFWLAGCVIFLAFLATAFLIKEEKRPAEAKKTETRASWSAIPNKRPILAMLMTGLILMVANMSIEPIITVYVAQLVEVKAGSRSLRESSCQQRLSAAFSRLLALASLLTASGTGAFLSAPWPFRLFCSSRRLSLRPVGNSCSCAF